MAKLNKDISLLSAQEKRQLLAELLEEKLKKGKSVYPLSYTQRAMWLVHQIAPETYNIPVAIRLKGILNLKLFEQSIREIIRRHETLRTTFTVVDEQPMQVIRSSTPFQFPIIDLQTLPTDSKEAEMQRLISEEALKPFDLVNGPLLRTSLLRLGEEENIFLLTMHHIVSDASSVGLFFQELQVLYAAFSDGVPSPLPELPIRYVDFAQWQHGWMEEEKLERSLDYWKKQLSPPLPVLNLPKDYMRPRTQAFKGASLSSILGESLSHQLNELGRQEDCTLFMVLLAAFSVLLYRLTEQSDILVGVPIAGRNRKEFEGMIGLFINTLVIRNDLYGNPSFRELIRRVRKVALNAYANQELPFEKLLEVLQPKRDTSQTPIFQVFLNMLPINEDKVNFSGLKAEFISRQDVEAKFDLTLYVTKQNKQVRLNFVYNIDLFSRERMEEMLRQLEWLLNQIAQSPDHSIDNYSLLTPHARQVLPDPMIALPEPQHVLLPQMIKAWVEQTPNQVALLHHEQHWTYAQLDKQVSKLARQLIRNGLKPGEVVAVCGSRSFNLIASMLAVFVSGGVLLTIDDHLPGQRKQWMLQAASARALIYVANEQIEDVPWADQLASKNTFILPASASDHFIEQTPTDTVSISFPRLSGDDPAYIFFTSGTTGKPKGVRGTHKGLSHFLCWQRDMFGIQPRDRAAQLTALSFDVVLRDVFLALVSGATLCLPDDHIPLDSNKTLHWLHKTHISIVHTVPTLAQTWLSSVSDTLSLTELRWVFFAGEPLTDELVQEWRKHVPHGRIVNLYGPTETTMAKCFYEVPAPPLPGIQPVGRPMPQTQALVLNKNGQLCGIGEPGQIVIRTPFRTNGYINAPEENTKKFVSNPFRQDDEDILYFTGDLGRFRPDGQLDILGRMDAQVKIRGNRIELSEIESILARHAAVRQAVASIWETEVGDKRLVAYIVTDSSQLPQTRELRNFLKTQLPDYMIPASFMTLEAIPLTPNGKVDRTALPTPNLDAKLQESFVPPQTDVEQILAKIWEDVLRLPRVGIHDNFFELGGHSLLATQVISRIQQNLKVALPIRSLFETPTIEELAIVVVEKKLEQVKSEKLLELLAKLEGLAGQEVPGRLNPDDST
jgi:amino acid adenylation domain-containing protein